MVMPEINELLFEITSDDKHLIYDMNAPDDKLKEIEYLGTFSC